MRRELDPQGCQTRVYGDRDVSGYQCLRKPVVTRDGKPYCKIHDPEYIKQKDAQRRAGWNKEWAERHTKYTLEHARREATKGLTLQELEQVTPDMIREILSRKED